MKKAKVKASSPVIRGGLEDVSNVGCSLFWWTPWDSLNYNIVMCYD